MFLDFHSTKQRGCHWLIPGHVALTKIKCILITQCTRSGYITARDQSMVQSGVIESGNFNFCE